MENSIFSKNRPRTRFQVPSPLMFESDEEGTLDEADSANSSNKENVNESSESAIDPTREERILRGFQTVLMGIPPPPAFTVPQLDSREILKLWRDHQKYKVVLSPGKSRKDIAVNLEKEAKTAEWPCLLGLDHWDVYYNKSTVSEEVEQLSVRYKERYVGCETSSCINAFFIKSPARTASARKRARHRAWGHSPGRRLSHLARRRKVFSSANLCSVAGNNNPDKKMIMVEIKKIGNRQKKKSSVKKTKPTPKKPNQAKGNTHKRALFQSPDQLLIEKESQTPSSQRIQRSKRNLFADSSSEKINTNGKRERTVVSRISPRKRVNRSLSFQENAKITIPHKNQPPPSSVQPLQTTTLSGAHKQKMLWAVTNALRDEGMGMSHELFRPCMSVLFKACQKLWLMKKHVQDGSTSENMLALAKQFTTYTIKEISADPTSEHMALVGTNIVRLVENSLVQSKFVQDSINKPSCSILAPNLSCIKENKIGNIGNSNENTKTYNCLIENNEKLEIKELIKPTCKSNNRVDFVKSEMNVLRRSPRKLLLENKMSPKKSYSNTRRNSTNLESKSVDNIVLTVTSPIHNDGTKSTPVRLIPLLTDSLVLTSPVTRSKSVSMNKTRDTSLACILHNPVSNHLANISPKCSKSDQPCKSTPTKSSVTTSLKYSSKGNRSSTANENSFKNESDNNNTNNVQTNFPFAVSSYLFVKSEADKFLRQRTTSSFANVSNQSEVEPDKPLSQISNSSEEETRKYLSQRSSNSEVEHDQALSHSSNNSKGKSEKYLNEQSNNSQVETEKYSSPINSEIEHDKNLNNHSNNLKEKPEKHFFQISNSSEVETDKSLSQGSINSEVESEKSLTQTSNCIGVEPKSVKYLEKDKENIGDQRLTTDCNDKNSENGKNISSQRHLLSVENTPLSQLTPTESSSRTLQLYKFANYARENRTEETEKLLPVVVNVEPPKLVPHWETEYSVEETSELSETPPSLVPHWEQLSCSGTSTSLPESIMTHWQQMSTNVNSSDKIMFDFEDTSYEINFPPNNDDTRASSICAPFDFSHFIDDSKSGFNTVSKRSSTDSSV